VVFGAPELSGGQVFEHRSTRLGRWLRARRGRIALWIAVIEGVLVVFGPISRWIAVLVALGAIAFYFLAGRDLRSDAARQASWIGAASQALVLLVPVLVIVVGTLALIVVAILAVIALVALFSDRA
jgi:hypothetical protein